MLHFLQIMTLHCPYRFHSNISKNNLNIHASQAAQVSDLGSLLFCPKQNGEIGVFMSSSAIFNVNVTNITCKNITHPLRILLMSFL